MQAVLEFAVDVFDSSDNISDLSKKLFKVTLLARLEALVIITIQCCSRRTLSLNII